jgi:tetratricopeptide (TPR) repeat protein/predicted Ser/Thr protein kinase
MPNMRVEPASAPEDDDATEVETDDRAQTNEGNAPRPQDQLVMGDRFGTYEIRGVLGRGAMGVVYDAWDTTLERRVALKLLRWHRQRSAERLIREARALARLDHPNVVKIWAAGVHAGSLYIAMERVEGQNLREWLRTPRTWNQVLPVMIAAGRGLAAAHAARVVHRDFKPENVLVGWDGRARVVDFGIARISPDHPDHLTSSAEITADSELSSLSGFDLSSSGNLTEQGSLIGTIRYMSPEQHDREPADERSDQYGFCLTLFEAVYGEHPFPARTQAELASKVAGCDISFPDELPVPPPPRWLRKLIVQGLAPDPRDRHASMSALAIELERYPARRRARGRMAVAGGLFAAALCVGVALPDGRAADQQPCIDVARAAEARIGSEARQPIASRYASLDTDWATPMAEHVDRELATWMGTWVEARTEICELRHGHRDATRLDVRREQCLDGQLDDVAALTEVLARAETDTLMNASRMLLGLPDPRRCTGDEPPERIGTGSEAGESLHHQLVRLRWIAAGGGDGQARDEAALLVASARELSSTDPERQREHALLLAESLLVLASFDIAEGREDAEQELREASRIADREGADSLRAQAWVQLGWMLATTSGRADEGYERLTDARVLLERVGGDRRLNATVRQGEGEALLARGDLVRARMVLDRLVTELEPSAELDPLGYAVVLEGLTRVVLAERKPARALELANQSITLIEGQLGPAHPLLASSLNNAGLALDGLGRTDEARASYERSVALRRAQLADANDPGTGRLLAEALTNLANLESVAGMPEAVEHYREALEWIDPSAGATVANVHYNLGVHQQIAGEHELAYAAYREALRLALPIFPDRSPEVAGARLGVGSSLVALGRFDEARSPLEQAFATWPEQQVGTLDEAELFLVLAHTRIELEGPSAASRALLDDARSLYLRHGETAAVDRVDALLR